MGIAYEEDIGITLPSEHTCKNESEENIQGEQGNIVDICPPNLTPRPQILKYNHKVLVPKIIESKDRLFFISLRIDGSERKEWKLIQIDLRSTMELNPSALTDGKFLANVVINHLVDQNHDIRQKRFWPYYHVNNRPFEEYSPKLQLIRPAPEAAAKNNLQKSKIWVHLTQPSMYIHGPFEFAIIHGRQTSDRISEQDWKVLIDNSAKYDDEPPKLVEPLLLYSLFSPFHIIHTKDKTYSL